MTDSHDEELQPNELLFKAEWLKNGNNGTKAWQHIYGEKVSDRVAAASASRLLKKANMQASIARTLKDIADTAEVTSEWALKRRMEIVERSMQAEPIMEFDYDKKEMVPTGEYKFDSAGANQALSAIEKIHLGMSEKKSIEHTGKDGKDLAGVNVTITESLVKKAIAKKQDEY